MSHQPTIARPAADITADLDGLYAQIRALNEQATPLLLELVRVKIHALIPDAQTVTLYATEWDNGWFYSDGAEITCTDGTVEQWPEVVQDAIADGADVQDDGGLDQVLLANLSDAYGACATQPVLTIDLVHLTARAT